jgi:hypothetical protein
MAHESFEDEGTAAFLNRHFVSVKVDREERPDLDTLYMRSVQLMTGGGGWPLTVFLTPSLKPFYGGTYFPPEERYGHPAFRSVLEAVVRAFRAERAELEGSSERVIGAVARSFQPPPPEGLRGPTPAKAAAEALLERYDPEEGGFGTGPKFPQPALLGFLLEEDRRQPGLGLREKVLHTLRKMEAGGVRDQVGGGFHRYSVDGRWHVPHFEKMLYDNAQLASLYFRAEELTGDGALAEVALEILDDLRRSMAAEGGGFVAALDADSEGEEGRFYLWAPGEVRSVLGAEGDLVVRAFGLTEGADLEDRVLHRREGWALLARESGLGVGEYRLRVRRALARLREARDARAAPGVDTKVLTDWNALAATAFLDGYRCTGDEALLRTGLETLDAVWQGGRDGELLAHVCNGPRASACGFLADYAFLARAHWRAYEVTGDRSHLERSRTLLQSALRRFFDGDSGLAYDSALRDAPEGLLVPVRDADDGVLPSAGAVLAGLLWDWERLSGEPGFRESLDRLLRAESGSLHLHPGAQPLLAALAASRSLPSCEVVVAAPAACPGASEMLAMARREAPAGSLVLPLYGGPPGPRDYMMFEGRGTEGAAQAYVCLGGACRTPAGSAAELESLLRAVEEEWRAAWPS